MERYQLCKCVWCNKDLDRNKEEYVTLNRRYAHTKCAKAVKDINNYMKDKLEWDYSEIIINKQIKNITKDSVRTPQGIYAALLYWYEIKKANPKDANGGINIVNYIYGEALDYYVQKEKYKNLNKEKYVEPEKIVVSVSPKLIKKPKRVKLFELE